MSDENFRLSGGTTAPLTPDDITTSGVQVMTQGIGYPLRPVSNAPPAGTGGNVNSETVAIGSFMQFLPQGWEAGKAHPKGSTLANGEWTMVANKLTLDSPYPVPGGDQEFGTEPWTPATASDLSVVYSGHLYTINGPVWARKINVWVPLLTTDTNYRIVIVTQAPGKDPVTDVIDDPILTVAWKTVALSNKLLVTGTTVLVYIDALNSGASNQVTGGWSYSGQDNVAAPVIGGWNQNNARTIVRINKTDLDSTDRTAELLGITLNSTLQFADTSNVNAFDLYRVTADPPVDQGTYIEYQVVLQEEGEGGVPIGVTTLTATIPIAQATEFSQEVGAVPTYTVPVTAIGFLQFGGVDQVGDANKYGIDVEFESVDASQDWDVLSYTAL